MMMTFEEATKQNKSKIILQTGSMSQRLNASKNYTPADQKLNSRHRFLVISCG